MGKFFGKRLGNTAVLWVSIVNELSCDRILNLIGTLSAMRQVWHCFYRTVVTPLPFALHTGMFMPCIKVFYFILFYCI